MKIPVLYLPENTEQFPTSLISSNHCSRSSYETVITETTGYVDADCTRTEILNCITMAKFVLHSLIQKVMYSRIYE